MTSSRNEAENPSVPTPLTASSEIIKIIFERLAELDNLSAVDGLHAAGLDLTEAKLTRISERLGHIEDKLGVIPSTTLPPTKIVPDTPIAHNPKPGKLRPKTKGQAFRDRTIAADERRIQKITEANNKPRKTTKGKK